jgi:hypothetical protein
LIFAPKGVLLSLPGEFDEDVEGIQVDLWSEGHEESTGLLSRSARDGILETRTPQCAAQGSGSAGFNTQQVDPA